MMRSLDQHVFENERTSQTPTEVQTGGGEASDWRAVVSDKSCHHIYFLLRHQDGGWGGWLGIQNTGFWHWWSGLTSCVPLCCHTYISQGIPSRASGKCVNVLTNMMKVNIQYFQYCLVKNIM